MDCQNANNYWGFPLLCNTERDVDAGSLNDMTLYKSSTTSSFQTSIGRIISSSNTCLEAPRRILISCLYSVSARGPYAWWIWFGGFDTHWINDNHISSLDRWCFNADLYTSDNLRPAAFHQDNKRSYYARRVVTFLDIHGI